MIRELTTEDRIRLAAGKERRRRPEPIRRSELTVEELKAAGRVLTGGELSKVLQSEWAGFLGRFPLDTFFTLTYSDKYAAEHKLYAMTSALNDFERWIAEMDYPGQYFVAAEPHFDRDVPHLHGLLDSRGMPLSNFWASWFAKRGRAKVEVPRSDAARYYCSKYSMKEANPDTVRFRLWKQTRRERRESNAGAGVVVDCG